jgi:predicted ABC-type ATPase
VPQVVIIAGPNGAGKTTFASNYLIGPRVHLAGGHGIPEEIIRRRFGISAAYFENLYKPIVDKRYIFERKC